MIAEKKKKLDTLVMTAVLTAIVVVLQALGLGIKFGPFAISLVSLPIIVGAALCGTKVSTWLGAVFGVVVLFTDAAAFFAISIPGTIITVMVKGIACGFAAGAVYSLFKNTSPFLAVVMSAIVCPIVNTGIFVVGCYAFFFEALGDWAIGTTAKNTTEYIFLTLIGTNFIIEFATNLLLSPIIVRILTAGRKLIAKDANGRYSDDR